MLRSRLHRTIPHLLWIVGSMVLILVFAFGLNGSSRAEGAPPETERWISFDGEDAITPQMSVLGSTDETIDLIAKFSGITAEDVKNDDGTIYTRFSGEGYGSPREVGIPDLPVFRKQVEIPYGARVVVEVISAHFTDMSLEELGVNTPYPHQPSVVKIDGAQENQPFVIDQDFYTNGLLYPATPVTTREPNVMRGRTIVLVETWPISYDPSNNSLRIYTDITFRLKLIGGNIAASHLLADRYAIPSYDNIFKSEVLNYNLGQPMPEEALEDPQAYIIITADAFIEEIQPFVALQQNYGFDVHVKLMSEFPGGLPDMKAYIQNAYDTWAIPPAYVLLVGDTNTVPTYVGVTDVPATDLYFVTMDGTSDWLPDMGRGRFPVRTDQQATNMVNKYLAYALLTGEEEWLKKIAFPATCDNYSVAEGTHNYVFDNYTIPKGYEGTFPNDPQPGGDKLYCVTHNATEADLIESYNDARKMVVYSGHGSYDGWELLDQSDVPTLGAVGVFPFVASHACMTGDYTQSSEVFGETWVLQANKGAIAFWGATTYTYWTEDDVLERAWFDSYFSDPEGNADISEMTNAGLLAVMNSGTSLDRYYYEEYNILGDPSMYIFITPRSPTFGIVPAETDLKICKPDLTTFNVEITSLQNYSATVTLSTEGLPAGVDTIFDPVSGQAPFTSLFTMNVGPAAPVGTYAFNFHGVGDDDQIKNTGATLTIYDNLPAVPELISPEDGDVDQTLNPVFDWADHDSVDTWNFQLDSNPFFAEPIEDQTDLTESTASLTTPIDSEACYWWRVSGDNACGLGDWAVPFFFSTQSVVFFDDMENGTANWTLGGEGNQWTLSTVQAHSPTQSFFAPDVSGISDTWIRNTTAFTPVDSSILSFWHMYTFEGSAYDGSVLEISTNGGSTWDDLGGAILENGYNGTISSCCSNPLGGREGWVGDLADWTEVSIDLGAYAGQNVMIRWRLGTDSSISDIGWYVDDVMVTGASIYDDVPVIDTVIPNMGSNTAITPITITGQFFSEPLYLKLGDHYLTDVTFVDATSIEAVIPAGLPGGIYTLSLYNGDCQQAVLVDAFTVTEQVFLTVEISANDPVDFGTGMQFTSEVSGTAPFTYTWDFGGSGSSSGEDTATPVFTYTVPGEFVVTLEVEDELGHSATDSITVRAAGILAFIDATQPVPFGQPMQFTSTITGTGPYTYTWNFGGDGTGDGLDTGSPLFTYDEPGAYEVTLTVDDLFGDTATATIWVNVYLNRQFLPVIVR